MALHSKVPVISAAASVPLYPISSSGNATFGIVAVAAVLSPHGLALVTRGSFLDYFLFVKLQSSA